MDVLNYFFKFLLIGYVDTRSFYASVAMGSFVSKAFWLSAQNRCLKVELQSQRV